MVDSSVASLENVPVTKQRNYRNIAGANPSIISIISQIVAKTLIFTDVLKEQDKLLLLTMMINKL